MYYVSHMIVRHVDGPNSPSPLTSMDVTGCGIQYYTDQWLCLSHATE